MDKMARGQSSAAAVHGGAGSDSVVVGLVQINNSFSGQNYLPYAAAVLQAYAEKHLAHPERFRFLLPIYKRVPIGSAVESLLEADIVGFSTYVWNGRISLEIARRLKAQRPGVTIVFGGPHVPDRADEFLRAHPFIDLVVHNEGEQTFVDILQKFPGRDWREVAGVSYLDGDGQLVTTPARTRLRDLDAVPSPFLEGTFEPLMRAAPDETWIALWETNRGCPFRCTFCDWGSATAAKVTKFENDRLLREVDWFSSKKIEFVFCCDANFGIQKRDVELAEYMAQVKRETGFPRAMSVQNTKNATERAYLTQKILSDAGLNKGVALSLQSVDPTTLAAVKRDNISLETYLDLQRRFARDRVETYSDLILGLPGETYESFVKGVNQVIETGQHNRIQFNNLSILPNAEMGDPAYQARYGMVTVCSKIINIHGERIVLEDDVDEIQDLVIATATMPHADWRRARAFCWMAALLHFDKLLQIPLITAHEVTGISYREMVEAFLDADAAQYPVLADIRDLFFREAQSIQDGGPEYVFSEAYLGIYWPADEFVFIELTATHRLDRFYREAGALLNQLLATREPVPGLIDDAIALNRALVRQPFVSDDLVVETRWDLLAFYQGVRKGTGAPLRRVPTRVEINRSAGAHDDLQTWCREVVWYGNKKGAYLYSSAASEMQLAGHY